VVTPDLNFGRQKQNLVTLAIILGGKIEPENTTTRNKIYQIENATRNGTKIVKGHWLTMYSFDRLIYFTILLMFIGQ
jgi:hypothetical protein